LCLGLFFNAPQVSHRAVLWRLDSEKAVADRRAAESVAEAAGRREERDRLKVCHTGLRMFATLRVYICWFVLQCCHSFSIILFSLKYIQIFFHLLFVPEMDLFRNLRITRRDCIAVHSCSAHFISSLPNHHTGSKRKQLQISGGGCSKLLL